jgi:SAM-dependent methyltransferase
MRPEATARGRCPICGAGVGSVVLRARGVDLVRCRACAHVRSIGPAPADRAPAPAERREGHLAHAPFLRRFAPYRGRLLDVGCGAGDFVGAARAAGWDAVGLPSVDAGRMEEAGFAPGSFDAVTFWDALAHVADPVRLLARVRDLLRPGGLLFVQTPDASRLLLRARLHAGLRRAGDDRAARTLCAHPQDFTARSLLLAVEHAGYADPRLLVLRPAVDRAEGRVGAAAKLGWYGVAWTSFAATRGRVRVSSTLQLAASA